MFEIPQSLRNRLEFSGFFDPLAADATADAGPPDAADFDLHDRFRAAYVRYSVRLGGLERVPDALDRTWRHIQRYLRGGDIPLDVVRALAVGAGVPFEWLLSGTGPEQAFPGIVAVQTASIRPSAGGGSELIENQSGNMPMPRALLVRLGLRPAYARLLVARGASMLPTIDDGDWMLVDVSSDARTSLKPGLVYVLAIDTNVFVKRLFREAGKWVMRSDNTDQFPDGQVVSEFDPARIIGRVRWVGRSL